VSLKKPSELFEQRRLQSLAEEAAKKEEGEVKNKKIASPKELFGEVVKVEEPSIVEEIVEEPVDPYLEEIWSLKNDLERVFLSIPEETDLTEVYQDIENLKDRIDNLPKQKSYDKDIQSIREELARVEGSIPVPEVFDPSDLYENISALKNKLEEVRSEIPTIPEPILYDYQLDQLKEMVVDVRNSIPVVPEIRYYEDELNEIINAIEEVRSEIPVVPEIKYYDDEISTIESRLVEIQESIPTVKYYDDELDILDQKIANVKESIPEVKYYDKDVKELKEQIASVKKSIPEVKYYDKDVKELRKEIASTKNSIPEVKYYDEDIQGLNEEVQDLYKKVSSIKIPDQDKYIKEVKGLYSSFEEKNHRLLEKINYLEEVFEKFNEETLTEGLLDEPPEVKNSDPLTPLDQNFVTLTQLQEHYRLFINRIQQQLASIGGGGETRLEFLDDVDRDSAKVNGRFLKYDAASGKWIGALGGAGGSQTLDDTLGLGNTSSLGMSVGLSTATRLIVDPVGGGTTFTEDLVVKGNARVTGILSIGTGTITLDPNDNAIIIADVKIRRDHSSGDIRFLDTGGNLSNIIANTVVVGSGNSAVNIANVNGTVVFTDSDNTVIHSVDRTNVSYLGNVSYSGIVTAAYFVGDGSLLTNVNIGYANTAGIATVAQGLTGTPNITVGVVTATKYYGDGSSLTGINAGGITSTSSINTTGIITANSYYVGSTQVINSAGQWIGSGLSVHSNIDGGLPNSIYGGIPVIDGGGV
jgi:prefoldin subunit 5